jgi:hypothetical protein
MTKKHENIKQIYCIFILFVINYVVKDKVVQNRATLLCIITNYHKEDFL